MVFKKELPRFIHKFQGHFNETLHQQVDQSIKENIFKFILEISKECFFHQLRRKLTANFILAFWAVSSISCSSCNFMKQGLYRICHAIRRSSNNRGPWKVKPLKQHATFSCKGILREAKPSEHSVLVIFDYTYYSIHLYSVFRQS